MLVFHICILIAAAILAAQVLTRTAVFASIPNVEVSMISKATLFALMTGLVTIPAMAQDAGWIGVVVEDQRD